MSKIALLTDSACDIPEEQAAKHPILRILPFTITVDGQSYVERQDVTFEGYYDILASCREIPKTSQITVLTFIQVLEEYEAQGYTDVIYVSINSAGSATNANAHMAARNFAQEHPDSPLRLHIVDSHTYSMGYGLPVLQAAEKLENGADVRSVVEFLENAFSRCEVLLAMYTLKFAKKSGRISAAAAFAGELLGLRPIIRMIEDQTTTVSKVRGNAAVMPAMVQYAKGRMEPGAPYLVGGTDPEKIKQLSKLCKKEFGQAPVQNFLLGAAVATNTGPDAVAIIYPGAQRR